MWWAEAQYSFIYRVIMCLKRLCGWIKKQTKLKIDICKWFLPCLLIVAAVYTLYYPYYKQTLEFKEGTFVIKEYPEKNKDMESVQEKVAKNTEKEEQANPIGDWGTFGDFIGGTLNPIIGFISILLLFATWKLTRKTLDFTKEELKNSNDLLTTQQFDAIFWGLFHNLKRIEEILYKNGDYGQIKINEIYYDVFRCNFSGKDLNHSERREKILKNAELSQYFICLYQIFKNIDERVSLANKEEEKKIKKAYSNILRASIPTKLLQLLAVNCHERFTQYKQFLEESNFLEHMPFYIIEHEKHLNLGLLECLVTYDKKVFDDSNYYKEFNKKESLKIFFDEKIQDYKVYINKHLMRLFVDEKSIEYKKINLKIFLIWKSKHFGFVWWGTIEGKEQGKESCDWMVTMNGIEIRIGNSNLYLIVNSFSNNLIEIKENPS
ncbi:putative phage abortive infection protein [Acinetobacter towneri]|uniref:putative phage abortive infection protein n=1 Tax=Acinetobacter towneri TaxID=202956 RepID=UPI00336BD731